MDITIIPQRLYGNVEAISSKSYAHRILIASALCKAETEIGINHISKDVEATISAIKEMGSQIEKHDYGLRVIPSFNMFEKDNKTTQISQKKLMINARESGSTARMILPLLCALSEDGTLEGEGSLRKRPFLKLCESMEEHGTKFDSYFLPINYHSKIKSGKYRIVGNESSQYISGLMFALPLLDGDSEIEITTELSSKGYIDMTIEVLRQFGIEIEKSENQHISKSKEASKSVKACKYLDGKPQDRVDRTSVDSSIDSTSVDSRHSTYSTGSVNSTDSTNSTDNANCSILYKVRGNQKYTSPHKIKVEGDWSNASYWICAGITPMGLNEQSLQNDRTFKEICDKKLIDGSQVIDLIPTLAVYATQKEEETKIYNVGRLKYKESNRIDSICNMINSLGGEAQIDGEDSIVIKAKPLTGGIVDSYNDHRIVMAAAVASCYCSEPVTILRAETVEKSYKNFFEDFIRLGGKVEKIVEDK